MHLSVSVAAAGPGAGFHTPHESRDQMRLGAFRAGDRFLRSDAETQSELRARSGAGRWHDQTRYNATYARPDTTAGDKREFNGLVRKGQKAAEGYADGDYASLQIRAFKIADTATYKENGPKDSNIEFDWDDQSSGTKALMDKDTTGWALNGDSSWQTVIGKSGIGYGNWVGYGAPAENPSGPAVNFYDSGDVIMFFKATFDHVVAWNSYGTKSIKFVNMTE